MKDKVDLIGTYQSMLTVEIPDYDSKFELYYQFPAPPVCFAFSNAIDPKTVSRYQSALNALIASGVRNQIDQQYRNKNSSEN